MYELLHYVLLCRFIRLWPGSGRAKSTPTASFTPDWPTLESSAGNSPAPSRRRYRGHEEGFVCWPVTFTDATPFGPRLTFRSVFTLIRGTPRGSLSGPSQPRQPGNFRISANVESFSQFSSCLWQLRAAISMADKSRDPARTVDQEERKVCRRTENVNGVNG